MSFQTGLVTIVWTLAFVVTYSLQVGPSKAFILYKHWSFSQAVRVLEVSDAKYVCTDSTSYWSVAQVDIQWIFNLPLAKIYTVSFISSLNSREILGSHFESRAEPRKNSSRSIWRGIRSHWGRTWSTKPQVSILSGRLADYTFTVLHSPHQVYWLIWTMS